jgi:hypothetical protein
MLLSYNYNKYNKVKIMANINDLRPHYGNYEYSKINDETSSDYYSETDTEYYEEQQPNVSQELLEPDYDEYTDYIYWKKYEEYEDIFPCSFEFMKSYKQLISEYNETSSDYYSESDTDNNEEKSEENNIIIKKSRIFDYV